MASPVVEMVDLTCPRGCRASGAVQRRSRSMTARHRAGIGTRPATLVDGVAYVRDFVHVTIGLQIYRTVTAAREAFFG
jgi:hypothetical protein